MCVTGGSRSKEGPTSWPGADNFYGWYWIYLVGDLKILVDRRRIHRWTKGVHALWLPVVANHRSIKYESSALEECLEVLETLNGN